MVERLPRHRHVSVRKALHQAWELDDADKAERLIANLARRLEHEAPGVAVSILEGRDEILTVTRLGLPMELRRSLACTNIIENMNGTIRRVCGNVKRWRDAGMALRWTAASLADAEDRSDNDDAIALFKTALGGLPQTDSLYVGYDNGSWLQVRRLDVLDLSERQ